MKFSLSLINWDFKSLNKKLAWSQRSVNTQAHSPHTSFIKLGGDDASVERAAKDERWSRYRHWRRRCAVSGVKIRCWRRNSVTSAAKSERPFRIAQSVRGAGPDSWLGGWGGGVPELRERCAVWPRHLRTSKNARTVLTERRRSHCAARSRRAARAAPSERRGTECGRRRGRR